jgi:hypothetical protein
VFERHESKSAGHEEVDVADRTVLVLRVDVAQERDALEGDDGDASCDQCDDGGTDGIQESGVQPPRFDGRVSALLIDLQRKRQQVPAGSEGGQQSAFRSTIRPFDDSLAITRTEQEPVPRLYSDVRITMECSLQEENPSDVRGRHCERGGPRKSRESAHVTVSFLNNTRSSAAAPSASPRRP